MSEMTNFWHKQQQIPYTHLYAMAMYWAFAIRTWHSQRIHVHLNLPLIICLNSRFSIVMHRRTHAGTHTKTRTWNRHQLALSVSDKSRSWARRPCNVYSGLCIPILYYMVTHLMNTKCVSNVCRLISHSVRDCTTILHDATPTNQPTKCTINSSVLWLWSVRNCPRFS